MSWTEADDEKLEECYDRLREKQRGLEFALKEVMVIITNAVKIKTKYGTVHTDKNKEEATKILPKDKWGEDMTDEYRLKTKDECIAKTNELLGVEHV